MEYKVLQNRTARFFAENQLLKFLFVLLAASNVLFGFMAYRAHHNHTTVLVPVGFKEKIIIEENRVSEAYLIQMARYAFDLALGYTPTNIRPQYELLLSLFDSSTYRETKKHYMDFIEEVETTKISSDFKIEKLEHDPARHVIIARGSRLLIYDTSVVEGTKASYALRYIIRDGRFTIKEIGEWKEMEKRIVAEETAGRQQ